MLLAQRNLVKHRLLFLRVHLGQSLKNLFSTEKSDLDDTNEGGLLNFVILKRPWIKLRLYQAW